MNRQGSATVFTAVIMPVIIVACVLLSDACLYQTGVRIIENSVNASAYSVLGKYSGYLKDEYELYAYCIGLNTAESIAGGNLRKNLEDSGVFDFRVEEISILPGGELTDTGTVIKMLGNIALDDVYKSLIDEILERFDILSGITGTAEIITLKMKMDKTYKKIKDSMTALNKIINGGSDIEYYVNLAGLDTEFYNAVSQFNEYRMEIISIEKELQELQDELSGGTSEKAGMKGFLEEQAGALRQKAADLYTSFIEGLIKGLMEANEEAVNYIKDIFMENTNIHILSDAIKNKIREMENCPGYIKEIAGACTGLVVDIEEAIVEQVFEKIKEELDNNIAALSKIEEAFTLEIEGERSSDSCCGVLNTGDYNKWIEYHFSDLSPGKGEDKRGFFEALGRKVLEKQTGDDVRISEEVFLPSMGTEGDAADFSASSLQEDTKNSEEELGELADCVNGARQSITRNLAINEYIMQHFCYETMDNDKNHENGYFANEIEYILWGSGSQAGNIFFTKAAVMSTRFALDAIHVYTDSGKCARADALAAATAGWWTMGAGIPVMSNLIKISWAIAESGADTRLLWNGESIPVIKTGGDWITDIGVVGEAVKTHDFLSMDYADYLRLYLAAVPIEKKILRMLDIISLNSPGDFNIFEAYTEITVSAVISFRSLTGGRHEVEISVTNSY